MTISETIHNARRAKGLTQQELAEMVGIKQCAVARIESGKHRIRLDILEKIAHALDIKITIG